NGVELRIRPPGYTSRTSTGEERIVVGDFTVDTAGTHQIEVGASPTPGLESLAIAPKESVSATRVVLGVIGAGLFVLGLLGAVLTTFISIFAHRYVRRSGGFEPPRR